MTTSELITSIEEYKETHQNDAQVSDEVISWIEKHKSFAFVKDNLEWHITGSLLITNLEKTKALLMLHKKLWIWVQFWWHCDGEVDVKNVAIREFHEESGISLEPFVFHGIFNIDIHDIPLDKKGTPPHKHMDILYLWMIPEDTPFSRQESEVDDIRWFDIEWIESYITERRMLSMLHKIYTLWR